MIAADDIAAAFVGACRDEIDALKPGNVHRFAPGHGMIADEFLVSAEVAAPHLAASGVPVGRRIFEAVEATFAAVGKNTNLGILLLCAPLAAAAERGGDDLRRNLAAVLIHLDCDDTAAAFAAIRLASPAGLGAATQHDVHAPAQAALGEVMAAAADRDRIARQYVSTYDDIFVTGRAALAQARSDNLAPAWTTTFVYLTFLASVPDTHLTRKYGSATAALVQAKGREMLAVLKREGENAFARLVAFDGELKASGHNPGTSADLTVATLFADRLDAILLEHRNDG